MSPCLVVDIKAYMPFRYQITGPIYDVESIEFVNY